MLFCLFQRLESQNLVSQLRTASIKAARMPECIFFGSLILTRNSILEPKHAQKKKVSLYVVREKTTTNWFGLSQMNKKNFAENS